MKREIWIFLFFLGVLVFSWPIISIFAEHQATALFITWLVFILLIFITTKFSKREGG